MALTRAVAVGQRRDAVRDDRLLGVQPDLASEPTADDLGQSGALGRRGPFSRKKIGPSRTTAALKVAPKSVNAQEGLWKPGRSTEFAREKRAFHDSGPSFGFSPSATDTAL